MITITPKSLFKIGLNLKKESQKRLDNIPNPLLALPADESEDAPDGLQRNGIKNFIPSNLIDMWTRLENLRRLKLFGHTDTLTEAGNLRDDFYKRDEIETERLYRNCFETVPTK